MPAYNSLPRTCLKCGKGFFAQPNQIIKGHAKYCSFECGKHHNRKHGRYGTPEYRSWQAMLARCYNQNSTHFKDYGGRGIFVCDGWRHSFESFFIDLGIRPSMSHTLDRFPNNDGNYEPGNCRWATRQEQARNRRSGFLITLDGVTKCAAEWEILKGLPTTILYKRIRSGMTPEEAMNTPSGGCKRRGEETGSSKLKKEQVLLIRQRVFNGEDYSTMMRDYGIGRSHVSRIVHRLTWNHLP